MVKASREVERLRLAYCSQHSLSDQQRVAWCSWRQVRCRVPTRPKEELYQGEHSSLAYYDICGQESTCASLYRAGFWPRDSLPSQYGFMNNYIDQKIIIQE